MNKSLRTIVFSILFIIVILSLIACKKAPEAKLSLYFREDWKEIPAETPVTQEHVSNPDLIVYRHGPGEAQIKKSHHDKPADDPWYIWSGECEGPWALTLQKKNALADLSSDGVIRWRTRQAGDRILRVVLGLDDGTWLVSEQGTPKTKNWAVSKIALDTLKWRQLEISSMETGEIVSNPSLNNVKNIGFSDLMPGGISKVCSRLDWIEVYTK